MNGSETTVHTKCINDQTLRSDIFHPKCPTNLRVNTLNIDLGATFPGENMVQGKNTLGYLRTRTFYTPERKYAYKYAKTRLKFAF
jgi:hypothetical protein